MTGNANSKAVATALFALLLLLFAWRAEALTVGELVVRTSPGEPLQAIVPLSLSEGESLATLRVTFADEARYAQRGLERPALLQGMRIALLAKGEGHAEIQLYGEQPWQGEAADILLHLRWPQGQLEQLLHIAAVESTEAATPLYVEVATNESLDTIAMRLSQGRNRSYLHMMVALYKANPEAFYRDNINNLKSGVRLRVPSNEELYRLSDAEVYATLREHDRERQAEREALEQTRAAKQRLEEQLQILSAENSEIEQRNRELQQRLDQLEQQVGGLTQQLLAQTRRQENTDVAPTASASSGQAPAAGDEAAPAPEKEQTDGSDSALSMPLLLLLMVLTVLAAVVVWRLAPRTTKGGA